MTFPIPLIAEAAGTDVGGSTAMEPADGLTLWAMRCLIWLICAEMFSILSLPACVLADAQLMHSDNCF